jgi:HK97 family phage portal protein
MRAVSFARLYMSQPWVAAAVKWLVSRGTRVPLRVFRRDDDPADRQYLGSDDHPLAAALLGQERQSQADLFRDLFAPMLVHGNSVTHVQSGANESLRFQRKDWRFCRPLMPFRDSIEGFQFDVDSPAFMSEVSIDEVLHIVDWSPVGPVGVSPLQQLGVTIQIEDSAQRYQRGLFTNGARPPSALTMSAEYLGQKPQERDKIEQQLRQDLTTLFAGPDNAGRPVLLPPGLAWKSVGYTTVEAELIEQRKITREEIAAVYQIPPPLLGILDRATYSNIQTQRDMTYTDILGPPLIMIEQAIVSQVCVNLLGETDLMVEFDFAQVLRGDLLEEIGALRDAIGTALLTPNEGRAMINLPQSREDGMDEFYLPFNNLQPVGHPAIGGSPGPPIPNPPGEAPPTRGKRLLVRERFNDRELEFGLAGAGSGGR